MLAMDLSTKNITISSALSSKKEATVSLSLPTAIKREPICKTMLPKPVDHSNATSPKLFRPWEVSPVKQAPPAHVRKTPSPAPHIPMTSLPLSSLGYQMQDPTLRMCLGVNMSPYQQLSPFQPVSPNDSGYQSTSPQGSVQSPFYESSEPERRNAKFLNAKAVRLMELWYEDNVDHPYPSVAVVDYLALQGNITHNQVKKWMSNKRVRCANTLPFKNKWMANQRRNLSGRFLETEPLAVDSSCGNRSSSDSDFDDSRPASRLFNRNATLILNKWFEDNKASPYPTDADKDMLAEMCGLSVKQVRYWFANKRSRSWSKKRRVMMEAAASPLCTTQIVYRQ